ncbi:peroxide stress protein YaaA [Lyngbya confervoides]|uniref:UPF0246 protein QQ91_0018465 n=1 Tax=Lyngbya confervoides BDU141951 TaxID=1574623 RepID=A0ABD4T8E8_9CYAN|nr:peroxide stress protein YaaA [Lyngbya confervoides]MCM1984809.1 peroxide stress protein YaaA [Lyngbya confervoides BDU141951]
MVISPAKTLEFQGEPWEDFSIPEQLDRSQVLVDSLRALSAEDLGHLMKISPRLAQLNFQRFQAFRTPFTPQNARQALFAFRGDVYKGIDIDTYEREDLQFAQRSLRILSGLYGVLRPLDLIQPYRLEMGTKLQTAQGNTLYGFWGRHISEQLKGALSDHDYPCLINLASSEYFKAVDPAALHYPVISMVFREKKAEKYKVVAIHAKRARGLMVDYAIRQRIEQPEKLQQFAVEGYRFSPQLSSDYEWVFCRG